jgi:hypothetical protein
VERPARISESHKYEHNEVRKDNDVGKLSSSRVVANFCFGNCGCLIERSRGRQGSPQNTRKRLPRLPKLQCTFVGPGTMEQSRPGPGVAVLESHTITMLGKQASSCSREIPPSGIVKRWETIDDSRPDHYKEGSTSAGRMSYAVSECFS